MHVFGDDRELPHQSGKAAPVYDCFLIEFENLNNSSVQSEKVLEE